MADEPSPEVAHRASGATPTRPVIVISMTDEFTFLTPPDEQSAETREQVRYLERHEPDRYAEYLRKGLAYRHQVRVVEPFRRAVVRRKATGRTVRPSFRVRGRVLRRARPRERRTSRPRAPARPRRKSDLPPLARRRGR